MSRWGEDPVRAGDDLLARSRSAIAPSGRVLLAGAGPAAAAQIASDEVGAITHWHRRMSRAFPNAVAEPPRGPFDTVLLRLPKGRAEQEMTLHQCLGVTAPGGRIVLYGGNEEGIRTAATLLGHIASPVDTLATMGHGRVVCARRTADLNLRPRLDDWRIDTSLTIDGVALPWTTYPGLFAHGDLDPGTSLLLHCLPPVTGSGRYLDFGCGPGAISAALRMRAPSAQLDMLDADLVALEAARRNVPGATVFAGYSLAAVPVARYQLIVSNPPIHEGIREDHTTLEALIAGAPRHLMPGGTLLIVVQRRIPLQDSLARVFKTVSVAAENGGYRVWRAA